MVIDKILSVAQHNTISRLTAYFLHPGPFAYDYLSPTAPSTAFVARI